jgi:hypothetical protein
MAILPIEYANKEEKIPWDNPYLPAPPFRLNLIAQSNSGKTTLILNLLNRDKYFYKEYFEDRVHVFSKSICCDRDWESLDDKIIRRSYEELSEKELKKIWKKQEQLVEKKGKTRETALLIIADDMIEKIINTSRRPSVLQNMYMRGRHANISVIITTQEYMLLPKTIRINASGNIIFRINNVRELDQIAEEHAGTLSKNKFKELADKVWSNSPWTFLFIDYTSPNRFRLNFTHTLEVSG